MPSFLIPSSQGSLREAWSDAARAAASAARKSGGSNAAYHPELPLGGGGIGRSTGVGRVMSAEKAARQRQHIKDAYVKRSAVAKVARQKQHIKDFYVKRSAANKVRRDVIGMPTYKAERILAREQARARVIGRGVPRNATPSNTASFYARFNKIVQARQRVIGR